MVIVQLMGGMGNQMFQYALGKHLAILNNTQLKLDTSILLDWSPGRHAVNRSFDLNIFNVNEEWASKKEISRYNSQLMNIPEKIIFKARKLFSGDAVLGEKFYHFDADVLNARGEIYIAGLWQSYRYFESIEQKIRTAFQFRLPLSAKASELHKRIKATNAVCVNVRRTDYVNIASTANTMGTIPVDYYKKALDIIAAKYDKPEIFIFSDDIAWCKEHLNIFKYPHFFVDHTYAGEQFSDYMQLMTACNHFIIPNSSFAWWAAWLNTSGDKIVIAPKKWMADTSVNTTDLIPNTWIRI